MATDNNLSERVIAAVDLGSSKIALGIARVEGNNTQILFYRSVPSRGIAYSEVRNPGHTGAVLKELIRSAEEELNITIRQVVVGLPRCNVRQADATGTLTRSVPEDCITMEEVAAIKDMAQESLSSSTGGKEKIYGVIAQSFSTDDYFQLIENDVVGMTGDELSGHFKVFLGKSTPIINLTRVFNDLGLGISRTYFTPLATAKAVLTEEETGNGVALLDMGAGTTSISIFEKKVLVDYASIPFGGNTITGDIHTECGISERLADNIKKAYGGCMPDKLQTLGDKIIQIETDDMSAYRQVPVSYLSEIITARAKEIIDAMLYEIQQSGLANDLRKGLVITGGGAEMLNIANYIKELSGYNVRVAYPRHGFVATGCEDILETDASTLVGMLLMARDEGLNGCLYNGTVPAEEKQEKAEPETVKEVHVNAEAAPEKTAGETEPEKKGIDPEEEASAEEGHSAGADSGVKEEKVKEQDKVRVEKPRKEKNSLWNRLKFNFVDKVQKFNDEIDKQEL